MFVNLTVLIPINTTFENVVIYSTFTDSTYLKEILHLGWQEKNGVKFVKEMYNFTQL